MHTFLNGETDHGTHGVDGIITGVVQVLAGDVEDIKHGPELGRVCASHNMLVHVAGIGNLEDIMVHLDLDPQLFEIGDVLRRIMEDEDDGASLSVGTSCFDDLLDDPGAFGLVDELAGAEEILAWSDSQVSQC